MINRSLAQMNFKPASADIDFTKTKKACRGAGGTVCSRANARPCRVATAAALKGGSRWGRVHARPYKGGAPTRQSAGETADNLAANRLKQLFP
jgi:hypothetical protein